MKPKVDLEELRRRIATIEATPPSAANASPLDPDARQSAAPLGPDDRDDSVATPTSPPLDEAPRRRARRRASDPEDGDAPCRRSREPDPQKLTEDALREAALSYLDKYDASVNQLRRVLLRRVDKYGDDATREPARRRIDELLERFVASRLLDDTRFAQGFVESARRRGASSLKIRSKLRARGVDAELVSSSLETVRDGGGPSELDAALTFARKRRLHKKFDLGVPAERQKALGSLARQGFSFDVARRVLELVVQGEEDDGAVF